MGSVFWNSMERCPHWDRKRRALETLHKMYLEDIEEGSLDECCPMTFPEFIQTEFANVKGQNEDWVRKSNRTGFFIHSGYANVKEIHNGTTNK